MVTAAAATIVANPALNHRRRPCQLLIGILILIESSLSTRRAVEFQASSDCQFLLENVQAATRRLNPTGQKEGNYRQQSRS
jgi:hypothetical protein